MPKKIEDIIVPVRKRSIRDVPIPESRRKNEDISDSSLPREHNFPEVGHRDIDLRRENRRFPKFFGKSVWVATGVAIIVLIFAALSIFNGATLAYVPKSLAISFDKDVYTAHKSGEGKLLYSIIKLSGDKGLDVSASGEEEIRRKASGLIIVYNTGAKQQRLRATTRFETPDGKTYQVQDAIVVPGQKIVRGVEEPGVIEVKVYAENPGEEFNIGLTDFSLPGLKGTSLFSSVYARSKTEMSGGFMGVEKVVNNQEKAQVRVRLETTLRDELISEARAQVPEDFILFPSLSRVTFEDLPQTGSLSKDSATVNIRGNLQGVMFKKSDLTNHLALGKITRVAGETIDLVALDSLNFIFVNTSPADLLLVDEIKFIVTGEVTAVWRTDEVALKADLAGKHKRDISSILNNYPTVLSATTTIRPFWKSSFPSDGARISMKKLPVN
ncbi:MAG: hypothetical protein Q7R69_02475 [bacterium]|nr:hypothetical protein [bacterium]